MYDHSRDIDPEYSALCEAERLGELRRRLGVAHRVVAAAAKPRGYPLHPKIAEHRARMKQMDKSV